MNLMRQDKLHPAEGSSRRPVPPRAHRVRPARFRAFASAAVAAGVARQFCAKRRAAFGKQALITAEPYTPRAALQLDKLVRKRLLSIGRALARRLLACASNIWSIFPCAHGGGARARGDLVCTGGRGEFLRLIARLAIAISWRAG